MRGVNVGVALLLVVMMLPYVIRWVWLGALLLAGVAAVTVSSWRGTRVLLARRRDRTRLRAALAVGEAHRVHGTVRETRNDAPHAVSIETLTATNESDEYDREPSRRARVVPFALETDDGRLVLVDPTHGYVASSLTVLEPGDRVTVLGPRANTRLDFLILERRGYRDGDLPLTLGGRVGMPIFLSPPPPAA
jgi:hypothetical protein